MTHGLVMTPARPSPNRTHGFPLHLESQSSPTSSRQPLQSEPSISSPPSSRSAQKPSSIGNRQSALSLSFRALRHPIPLTHDTRLSISVTGAREHRTPAEPDQTKKEGRKNGVSVDAPRKVQKKRVVSGRSCRYLRRSNHRRATKVRSTKGTSY